MRRSLMAAALNPHSMKPILSALALATVGPLCADESAPLAGTPFAEEAYWAPVLTYPQPGSLHGVFNLDFANQDVTPHGLLLEDQGLMIQPLLLLYTPLYADPTRWLSNLTFTVGGWGNWHSRVGGEVPANWREVDLFAGLTCIMERNWQLSAFYSAYLSQTESYPTAWDCAIALSYDDADLSGDAALHPFIEFKQQTEGSTTMAFVTDNADESYSFRLGVIPRHQFEHFKLEVPTFLTLVPEGFYQLSDGQPAPGGIGFMSAALKLTVPVESLSTNALRTSLYAAAQYYRIANAGLLDVNQALGASGQRDKDIVQFHLGLNVSF